MISIKPDLSVIIPCKGNTFFDESARLRTHLYLAHRLSCTFTKASGRLPPFKFGDHNIRLDGDLLTLPTYMQFLLDLEPEEEVTIILYTILVGDVMLNMYFCVQFCLNRKIDQKMKSRGVALSFILHFRLASNIEVRACEYSDSNTCRQVFKSFSCHEKNSCYRNLPNTVVGTIKHCNDSANREQNRMNEFIFYAEV